MREGESTMSVNTATGGVAPLNLGRTLMHEHLLIGITGWDTDPEIKGQKRSDFVARCVDQIQELKDNGFTTLLDPCPMDMGRDVALSAEVAARTGFNIVMVTGLFGSLSGGAYWRYRQQLQPDFVQRAADIFIREITKGIGDTDVKAGVIKIANESSVMTDYEKAVFEAAAIASSATGAPITTHTAAVLGDDQIDFLTARGVPAHRIIVGHCCCTRDHDYHMRMVEKGSYVAFDRFGATFFNSDEARVESIVQLRAQGRLQHIVLSTDTVMCGRGIPEMCINTPMHISRVILPMMRKAGITETEIETLLTENPRRYFSDQAPALCEIHPARDTAHGGAA
jgi:phosphotriesterase-related protein